jgi:nucleoporin NUP159
MPESTIRYVQTDKGRTKFEFREGLDLSFPFHSRNPASHFISRIRKWTPLEDVVITLSAAGTQTALITNSQTPLTKDPEQSKIVNQYNVTTFEQDGRRAALPISVADQMSDTVAIGTAVDFSSDEKVYQPIPGDDILTGDSPHPLPGYVALNHEGVLSYWWFVNDEALRRKEGATPCPGLVAIDGGAVTSAVSPPAPAAFAAPKSPFAQQTPGFGTPAFQKPAAAAFGAPSFGTPSTPAAPFGSSGTAAPAFGGPSLLGGSSSPWAQKPAQATPPAFGSATPAAAFGSASGLGRSGSVWGAPPATPTATIEPKASPFGGAAAAGSGFAKLGSAASPFAGFAGSTSKSAFAAPAVPSSFGTTPLQSFGSTVSIDSATGGSTIGSRSVFGAPTLDSISRQSSVFGRQASEKINDSDMSDAQTPAKPIASGIGSSPFKLGSTFRPGTTAKEQGVGEDAKSPFGNFGSLSSNLHNEVQPVEPKKALFGEIVSPNQKPPPMPTPLSKQIVAHTPDPEPPQVTSKPIPSPATGTSSGSLSVRSLVNDQPLEKSPDIAQRRTSDSAKESGDEGDVESGEEVDSGLGSNESSPRGTPVRRPQDHTPAPARTALASSPPEILTGSSIVGGHQSSPEESPIAPKTVLPEVASAVRRGVDVLPPAPTPPAPVGAKSHVPLFGHKSTTPAGLPQQGYHRFPPPKAQESPRSPSPVRHQPGTTKPPNFRPSPIPEGAGTPQSEPASVPGPDDDGLVGADALEDDEDERIRAALAQPVRPTLRLDPFLAHQDYAGRVTHCGVGGNVERVYRDVNGMLDTLGLNARALAAFVAGQEAFAPESDSARDIEHLEHAKAARYTADYDEEDEQDEEDERRPWTLDELPRVAAAADRLAARVDRERVRSVLDALADLAAARRDVKARRDDVRRIRAFIEQARRADAGELEGGGGAVGSMAAARKRAAAPLDAAWLALQRGLRARRAEALRRIAEAEDGATVARAKLAARAAAGDGESEASSVGSAGGRIGHRRARSSVDGAGVPTVEAVEATIRKMTAMAEKRSGDVDVLEVQMRKLGLTGRGGGGGDAPSTPTRGKSFDDCEDEDGEGTGRKRRDGGERAEKTRQLVDLRARRRAVLDKLREGLERRGEDLDNMAVAVKA